MVKGTLGIKKEKLIGKHELKNARGEKHEKHSRNH